MALIIIIFGRAAQFLIALATLRVATTLLSPEEMGKVALILTTISFFALLLINPVGMFINRRLHAWQASGVARAYLLRYSGYLILIAILAAFVLSVLSMAGHVDFGVPVGWLIALACSSLIFNTINQTAIPSLNLLGDSKRFIFLTVATLVASFLAAVALILTVQRAAQYWVLGLIVGQMLLAILGTRDLFTQLRRHGPPAKHPDIQSRHFKALFAFSWPVAIAAGLGCVQTQGYRYIMADELGLAQVGLFVAGYGLSAGIIAGFESVLTTYFQPRLYRDVTKADTLQKTEAWQRYATAVVPSLMLTVALLIALAPELTRLLLGKNFQSASDYLIWGALAEAARVLASVYSLIAHAHMRTRWLIWPSIIGAVTSMLVCALLIPSIGVHGAGIGLVGSGFLVVIFMHNILLKKVGTGMSLRPMLHALAMASGLWMLAWGLRQWLPSGEWLAVMFTLMLTGLTFGVAQYLLLRRHLDR